jgi:hypothetical protein
MGSLTPIPVQQVSHVGLQDFLSLAATFVRREGSLEQASHRHAFGATRGLFHCRRASRDLTAKEGEITSVTYPIACKAMSLCITKLWT